MNDNDKVLRKKHNKNYKTIYLEVINNSNLSYKAKGLHTYLMSKPDGWNFNYKDLQKRSTNGQTSVKSGLDELEEHGYLKRIKLRDDSGRITRHQWIVAESQDMLEDQPDVQNPYMDNQYVDDQDMDSDPCSNKVCSNKVYSNKDNGFTSDENSFTQNSKEYQLAKKLKDYVDNNSLHKTGPDLDSSCFQDWCLAIDRLHRLGATGEQGNGYDYDEIKDLIEFSQNHDFWWKNILSATKLRKQAVKLEAQMKDSKDNDNDLSQYNQPNFN